MIESDPSEQHNLYAQRPVLVAAMTERLSTVGGARASLGVTESRAPSTDTRDRLAALGYVSGARPLPASLPIEQLPDPKDRIVRK